MKKIAAFFVLSIALMSAAPRFDDQTITQSTYITSLNTTRAIELGQVKGYSHDAKYGWNKSLQSGVRTIISATGGQFTPSTTEEPVVIVSSSATDTIGGTGARKISINCVSLDATETIIELDMNGTGQVVTPIPCAYINRIAVVLSGSSMQNNGLITATQQTSGKVLRSAPIGSGLSQSCLYVIPKGKKALVEDVTFTIIKYAGGQNAKVTFTGGIYIPSRNTIFRAFEVSSDSAVTSAPLTIKNPYALIRNEGEVIWFEATANQANTQVTCRANLLVVDAE